MISVIIPLMPVEPYDEIYMDAVDAVEGQTISCEIVVSRQDIMKFIRKNALLNTGIQLTTGDIVWFCDADFLPEPTLLERMETKLIKDDLDVIYPMFYSKTHKALKIADGAAFIKRSVLQKHGKQNNELFGISWVTFPFLKWCMDNTRFHCSDEFIININETPQRKAGKRHYKTSGKLRGLYRETVKDLQEMGVWP